MNASCWPELACILGNGIFMNILLNFLISIKKLIYEYLSLLRLYFL